MLTGMRNSGVALGLVVAASVTVSIAAPAVAANNGDVPVNTPESARRMIEDLRKTFGDRYKGGAEFDRRLGEIEGKLKGNPGDRDARAEFDKLIREASLANPLLDFGKILVIRRTKEANRRLNSHTTDTIKRKGWDNEISELSNLRGDVQVRTVYRAPDQSIMKHMDLHFSGKRIMFSGTGKNGNWAVLEVDGRGGNLRELTPADQKNVQWFDGCYLPEDGYVLSCSTAGMQGLPCENGGKPMVNLYRVDTKSKGVRQLTFEQDSDWHPRVLPNGRVMYLRWEYTDTPHYYSRYLFHMNPDGTSQMEYWGSGSYFPTAFVWARPVPDHGSMVAGIVSGHHAKSETGRLMLINPALGRKYPFRYRPKSKVWGRPKSTANVHPEVFPAEVTGCVQEIPGWGRDVVGNVYDGQGGGQKYTFGTPYPLSDKYFLVSMRGFSKESGNWTLCLVDVFDNMTTIHADKKYGIFEPIPFVAREKPRTLPDRTMSNSPSTIFCTDIYYGPGLKNIPRGTVKSLRVFSYHFGYIRSGGHESVGLESSWDIKRVLGTVPVEEDGSFFFQAPANTPLALQPLDEDGAALALMRSWLVAMPGENLSCNGCHENQNSVTPNKRTIASRKAPRKIEPWQGPARPFAYRTEIQPMLGRLCVGCHNDKDRKGKLSFETGGDHWRKDKSYLTLASFVRRPGPESDLDLFSPMEWHASTSPLVQMFRKGHNRVKLGREDWERLYTWIDLNAPHRGMWSNPKYETQRLELAKLYASVDYNPEEEHRRSLAELAQKQTSPVMPPDVRKPAPDGLTARGFPVTAEEAAKLQRAGGEMELELAPGVTMRLARIPRGEFVMGSQKGHADEAPRAVVRIATAFGIGVHEVTNAQYAAFDPKHDTRYIDEHGKDHSVPGYIANHDDQPVSRVSWQEAVKFCEWLSRKTGRDVKLPTEAQWEWAARAGGAEQFYYGDGDADFSKWANLADASRRKMYVKYDGGSKVHVRREYPPHYTFPLRDDRFVDRWFIVDYVRQYTPSAWGLYDMVGNVSEWTRSDYRDYPYNDRDGRNASRPDAMKVARGGSWSDRPKTAGSSVRFAYESYQKVYNVGFRVVVEGARDAEFALAPVPPVVAELEEEIGAAPTVARLPLGEVSAKDGGGTNDRESPRNALDGDTRTKWYHNGAKSTWV
ncbi:MAG: SUMF1/EgtB/PvdO family nonheme iron enzyme, partial [Planctomycetota bacterium]